MKNKIYSILIGMMFIIASCEKTFNVDPVTNFDVTADVTSVKVGTPVTFTFSGDNLQMLSFYSGEDLKDYAFKDGHVVDVAGAGATMEFTSSVQVGTQINQLSVLASTNFNGDYSTLASVKAATWTDITSRFTLGTSASFLASGTKDISDLMVSGKPIYIAFKYVTKPQEVNGLARNWWIQTFTITSNTKFNNSVALNLATQDIAGFRIVDQEPVNAPSKSTITSTRISLLGPWYRYAGDPLNDPTNPIFDPKNKLYDPYGGNLVLSVMPTFVPYNPNSVWNDPATETWAVSKAINTTSVDLGYDKSLALKGVMNPIMNTYTYKYAKVGTYKAVFVAANTSIDDICQVTKELTITVTP